MTETLHGTCVCVAGTGVLLIGSSGSGKSDLALRLIDSGGVHGDAGNLPRLVSDDRVIVQAVGTTVMARPPDGLAGRLEVRGVGVLRVPCLAEAVIGLVVRLVPPAEVPRMPDRDASKFSVCGFDLPLLCLAPFEASAPAKIKAAVHAMVNDGFAEWLELNQQGT